MPTIFFDLETTDRETVGQILNFSFICVDKQFEPISEYSGDIRISRLQLPDPGAILANRVNVIEHQERTTRTERDFCRELFEFITNLIEESGEPVTLIGYNSFRFDLAYLRTVMIRNGISPYFRGKLIYRDLYAASRKLSISHSDFPRTAAPGSRGEAATRLSLSLETICTALKVLDGAQLHHARADTILTIRLAQLYLERFGLDVRKYEGYEGGPYHKKPRAGEVISLCTPQYDLADRANRFVAEPVTLLDVDNRGAALWINLKEYQSKSSRFKTIIYAKPASSFIFGPRDVSKEEKDLAKESLKEFADLRVSNFFTRSVCDIEMDIYRVDFDGIDALHDAIWRGDKTHLKKLGNRDCSALYTRYLLANVSSSEPDPSGFEERFAEYVRYRYGGKMLLSRSLEPRDDGKAARYHPTLDAIRLDIEARKAQATTEDLKLLEALERFIEASDTAKFL